MSVGNLEGNVKEEEERGEEEKKGRGEKREPPLFCSSLRP